jgi:hypothetical protein
LDLSEEFKTYSGSELSPSESRDEEGEVTVCDHFTFLEEVSELEVDSLLEPKDRPNRQES